MYSPKGLTNLGHSKNGLDYLNEKKKQVGYLARNVVPCLLFERWLEVWKFNFIISDTIKNFPLKTISQSNFANLGYFLKEMLQFYTQKLW